MRVMITGSLIGASVFLFIGFAQANPIDDCNQSADLEKQIDGCTLFLQLNPFSPHVALAYGRRAEAYVHRGDLARAIADFDQAIRIDPRQARFLVGRGLAHREHGDLDSALADFSKAIEIDPALPMPSSIAASPTRKRGRRNSRSRTAPAIAINPKDAVAYNDRGVAYEKTGNIDGALADYSKAIELDPTIAMPMPIAPCSRP